MHNPFEVLQQELAEVKLQNAQILQQLQQLTAKQQEDKYLSIDEVRKMWQPAVSRSTVYAWEQAGHLKRYLINAKPCFLKSEVMEAAKEIRRYKKGGDHV